MRAISALLGLLALLVPAYRYLVAADAHGPSPWPVATGLALGAIGVLAADRLVRAAAAERRRILETGLRGTATILAAHIPPSTPSSHPPAALRLRIDLAGREPYEIDWTGGLAASEQRKALVGAVIEVRVDRDAPGKIALLFDED
jgi:hypothetical protein